VKKRERSRDMDFVERSRRYRGAASLRYLTLGCGWAGAYWFGRRSVQLGIEFYVDWLCWPEDGREIGEDWKSLT